MNAYNRRQLTALAFVFSLAPMMRLIPKQSAAAAQSGSWLTPAVAFPFIILYIVFLACFLKNRKAGEGMGEMIKRAMGKVAGGIVLVLIACNALFYCGFILRSGADRFVSAIYPAATSLPFVFVMLTLGFIAALGPKKAIVRTAKIFSPILAAVLVLVLFFGLITIDISNLFPVARGDVKPILFGAVPVFNIYAAVLMYCSFLEDQSTLETGRAKHYILWMLPVTLLLTADIAAIVGNFGAPLTARLTHPFFTMLRDITLFNTIERIEAFVVTLWVIPDFIVFATALTVAVKCLQLVFDFKPAEDAPLLEMKNGRWLIPLCGVVAAAVAFTLSSDFEVMQRYSAMIIPMLNLAVSLVLLPLCFIVGKIRKTI